MKLTDREQGLIRYIRQYPEWVSTVECLCDMRSAITYDADKVQTSPNGDTVIELVVQIEAAQERIDKVERCLANVYRTDERINDMRNVFCYGGKSKMRRREFYTLRKLFAGELVEVFSEKR